MIPEGGVYPIVIYQGADFRVMFAIREADQTTVIPLTGFTAFAQLRQKERTDAELLAVFTCLIDEAGGTVTIHLQGEQTSLLTGKKGFYDVFVTDAGGSTTMLVEGQATINPGVTALVDTP